MNNFNNQYIQVPSGLAQEIRDMKESQNAIPHYEAKVLPIGDLTKQSKYEIMLRLKHNIDEIEKQYRNEEEKGWISSSGYTRFSYHEKYVFPVIEHVFDINGLSSTINKFAKEQCYAEEEHEIARLGKEEYERINAYTAKERYILRAISLTDGIKNDIIRTIEKVGDIRNLRMYVSLDLYDVLNFSLDRNAPIEGIAMPSKLNFILVNESRYLVLSCTSSSKSTDVYDTVEEVMEHWEEEIADSPMFKLSSWKENIGKMLLKEECTEPQYLKDVIQ